MVMKLKMLHVKIFTSMSCTQDSIMEALLIYISRKLRLSHLSSIYPSLPIDVSIEIIIRSDILEDINETKCFTQSNITSLAQSTAVFELYGLFVVLFLQLKKQALYSLSNCIFSLTTLTGHLSPKPQDYSENTQSIITECYRSLYGENYGWFVFMSLRNGDNSGLISIVIWCDRFKTQI